MMIEITITSHEEIICGLPNAIILVPYIIVFRKFLSTINFFDWISFSGPSYLQNYNPLVRHNLAKTCIIYAQ
jgi:hypothetical protein